MKWLVSFVLSSFLVGCAADHSMSRYRMTESGYPAVNRNDFVLRNTPASYDFLKCGNGEQYCVHKCDHIKEPTYEYHFVPPIYKPIFIGVDREGHDIYERMLVTGGYYDKVFAGYRCYLCNAKL